MNCAQHPEVSATAFCRECGTPMCAECSRPAGGTLYCATHAPVVQAPVAVPALPVVQSPYTAAPTPPAVAPDPMVHPGLALFLGFIPGVGAIYNSQYVKGLIHVLIFGFLVATEVRVHDDAVNAFVGILIAAWEFYMAFEAMHTARKRRLGVPIDEFGGHLDARQPQARHSPAMAFILIGLGFVFLLDTMGILSIDEMTKFWPLFLIAVGVYMLYGRLRGQSTPQNESGTAVNPDSHDQVKP